MPTPNPIRPRGGMAFRGQTRAPEFGGHGWLGNRVIAAGEGLFDGASWGQGDKAYAGIGALIDALHGASVKESYRRRIAYEQARDAYYEQHYGLARGAGEVVGAFVPIPGAGVAGVARLAKTAKFAEFGKRLGQVGRLGDRIKQAAAITQRERVLASGAGAATGATGQLYSDAMSGHLSSLRDYGAAMAGGALQAQMAIHGRPMMAGAGGAAATSALDDVFNGRPVSLVKAAEAGEAGGAAGAFGEVLGNNRFYRKYKNGTWTERSNQDKAALGENLSKLRTRIAGDRTVSTEKRKLPLSGGGHTFPDQVTQLKKYIESKAGIFARLSKRQLQAYAELGANFRVDHLLPRDLGAIYGFVAAQGGSRLPAYFQPDQYPQDE